MSSVSSARLAPGSVPSACGCWADSFWLCREMKETNGLLTEELEGLQRKLGRQEKLQGALVDLELEKEVSPGVGCTCGTALCPVHRTLATSIT